MKIITLNTEGQKHLEKRILPWLREQRPDVFCVQEFAEEQISDVTAALSEASGKTYASVFHPTIRLDDHPGHNFNNPPGAYGVAIFFPMTSKRETGTEYFFKTDAPIVPIHRGAGTGWGGLAWAELALQDQTPFRIATTHFTWADKGGTNEAQARNIGPLMKIVKDLSIDLFCGDFNAPRGGVIFSQIAEQMHDNIPASVKTTMDQHLHRVPGLQLVVDGFFSKKDKADPGNPSARNHWHVEVVEHLSDHCALVGENKLIDLQSNK